MILTTAAFIQPRPRPDLKPIDYFIITPDRPPEGLTVPSPTAAQAIVILGITNAGNLPSIVIDFHLSAKVNGETYYGERYAIPDTMSLNVKGRQSLIMVSTRSTKNDYLLYR
jgi:hypothetical protein